MDENYLNSLWEQAKANINIENTNIDLKQKWWDKSDEEFLKDICSMANNHSGDSYLIIGMDEKGKLIDAPIPENEANIQQRLNSRVEPKINFQIKEFELDGKKLSVITIPHSSNRPHIIKTLNNLIPVRMGSSTSTASRPNLDEMYKEKDKSNSPDLKITVADENIEWTNYALYSPSFAIKLTIDNSNGGAAEFIMKIAIKESGNNNWESKFFKFDDATRLNQEYKINANDRKTPVCFYVSDRQPDPSLRKAPRPDLDLDKLKIVITTLNSGEIEIETHSSWFKG